MNSYLAARPRNDARAAAVRPAVARTSRRSVRGSRVLLLLLLTALLPAATTTGCVRLLRKAPEKHYYVLDTARAASPAAADEAATRTLAVRRFRVSPPYDSAALVYFRGDARYEADFYNEFFLPPASMYTERASRWFEASGLFGRVAEPASALTPTHALEGAVTRACGDFSTPSKPLAMLDVQFLLLDVTRAEPRIVVQKNEHVAVPLAHTTASAVVGGLNEALRQALEAFETEARQALDSAPPAETNR